MEFSKLPDIIPVFPLDGVLLLPRGHLPLNIFEPRYIAMVEDALRTNRLIGMIQPSAASSGPPPLFKTGCAGKIVQFQETEDGRYLITLKGVARFEVQHEVDSMRGYRQVRTDWSKFSEDFEKIESLGVNRSHLVELLQIYFEQNEMSIDWKLITAVNDEKLMTCLAMICPFTSGEKQALIEEPTCKARADLFMKLLEMAVRSECCSSKH
ncbi:MAG: peptidase S16 [Micavibrio aeruginosavorus]|uniref:Peptidase S16 n=1 Tax=Micavibrio aeruginosavorus TaxID=349221 RepID=A0A2W5FQQ5_9BACT|nr:MAG: peptidase S16 [Micavibrio aeruginosavorus]